MAFSVEILRRDGPGCAAAGVPRCGYCFRAIVRGKGRGECSHMTTEKKPEEIPPPMTTAAGAPVVDDQHSQTAGPTGPVLIQDHHLLEKLAQFNRERIPERVVHAKGSGAFGHFEVTRDVRHLTKAHFLGAVGKRTEVFVRFSQVAREKGTADTHRDPRGFAVKFYTEEGNYDLAGNNTPVFFIRDPLKFPDFIHSQKRPLHQQARARRDLGLLLALPGDDASIHLALR